MKWWKWKISLALAGAMLFSSASVLSVAAQAEEVTNIYVAEHGSDSADGTEGHPVATLWKAAELAREQHKPVTISVAAGKYFMSEPLFLTEQDSDVSWEADGEVILTGAKPLGELTWTEYTDGILVAETERNLQIDQLFLNGKQQILARYPNYDSRQALQGASSMEEIRQRSAGWADPSGGYIRALHDKKWGGNSYRITGKGGNALGLTYTWVGDNNRGSGMHSGNIMVENIFEELDSEKEWFYSAKEGKLYVKPDANMTLSGDTQVEAAVAEELIHISGAKNVSFTGFTLENTARTMFTGQYVPLMRSDWCVVRSGALYMENAENIKFMNGTIRNIGGNAVFMSGHNQNNVIKNNDIHNIGSSGVLLAGDPNSCREPSFWDHTPAPEADPYFVHKNTVEDRASGPKAELYPVDCEISYNHIKNVGIWEKQSSHVAMSVASRIKVLHNTINVGPRAGINVGDGTFGGHEIAYNDVFDVQLETDDHGMFNSWGRDRFWSLGGFDTGGNNGVGKEPVSLLDCYEVTKIHDNRMHFGGRVDGGSTFGIDLDDGSSNYEIYNNLCLNMGIKLREGFHRKVYNNILINGAMNLHCTFEDSHDQIERNLVVKGNPYSLAATGESRFAVSEDQIDRNWYWDLGSKTSFPDFWDRLAYDQNSIMGTADPHFQSPESLDYTVTNETAAKQIGFVNFPMDQFGKPGCPDVCPGYVKEHPDSNEDILEREIWLGATISVVDDAIMSSTGAGSLKGVYLENVPDDSEAAAYGFQTADVIHTLNGVELVKKSQFIPLYDQMEEGDLLHADIIRNQLAMDLNFIKNEGGKVLVDDRDPQVQYGGEGWEYAGPSHNADNSVQCYHGTMTYKNVKNAGGDTSISLTFEGDRVVLYGRKENNMGEYNIEIRNAAGEKEVETTASAHIASGRKDREVIYDSGKSLKKGQHTITITHKSGDYIIVDAFGVYGNDLGRHPSTVGPVSVTNKETDDRVTALTAGEVLRVVIPVANTGDTELQYTVTAALYDGNGLRKMLRRQQIHKTLAAGQMDNAELEVAVPTDCDSMRLAVIITDSKGAAMSYPVYLDGVHVEEGAPIQMTPNGEDTVELSYVAENQEAVAAWKGGKPDSQVVMTVMDGEHCVMVKQAAVSKDGVARFGFDIDLLKPADLIITMVCEDGTTKSLTQRVDPNESLIHKESLRAAMDEAEAVLKKAPDGGNYTSASWNHLKRTYYAAQEILNRKTVTQHEVQQAEEILRTAIAGMKEMTDANVEITPNASLRGTYFEIFSADGSQDGGNRDGQNGDWQIRENQVDATVPGAWLEMTNTFQSLVIKGANKHDSANFKVQIGSYDSEGAFVAQSTEEITQSKDQNDTQVIYTKQMDGARKTVRIIQNDTEGRYLEIRGISYSANVDKKMVESVSMENSLVLTSGGTAELHAEVKPSDAYDTCVTWKSDHPEIVSVSYDGTVTALQTGKATITVTTDDGGHQASCVVTVTQEPHDVSAKWSYDAEGHWHTCTVCDQKHEYGAHTWNEGVIIKKPDKETYGEIVYTCTVCNAEKKEMIDPLPDVEPDRPHGPDIFVKPEKPEAKPELPFTDVTKNDWFYGSVYSAWENDLLDGMTAAEFAPNGTLTVAQTVKLAAALHQREKLGRVTLSNGAEQWYSTYVDYAIANGILETAYAQRTPAQMNKAVSRREFVKILHGAMAVDTGKNKVADNAIPDVKLTDKHGQEIYDFYRAGILTGSDEKGTFYPETSIKRSEAAAILVRMYDTAAREPITLN